MKKFYFSGIYLCIVIFLLSGCSLREEDSSETSLLYDKPQYDWGESRNITLTLWSQKPEIERIYMKRAIENYETATGNRIEIEQYSQADFQNEVFYALDKKMKTPDLILSYGGTNIDIFCPDENFYDFTDAIWVDDLTDTAINQAIYHGKVIGLPHWEASIAGIIYNKEIFDTYHIKIPKNQKEFLEACETLLEHNIIPVYLPFQEPSMLLYQFALDTIVKDSNILEALNNGSLHYSDIPEMESVIKSYKTMADKGYFGADFLTNSWEGMNEALKSEKYAMMLCWDTWLYTDFDGEPSKFGLMPAFLGVPDTGTFEGPNLGLLIVNKNSENLSAALDFITFLADPYNYNKAFEGIYTAPVFKHQVASISTPQYIELERVIEQNYHDSIAWLRIKGFSQMDASCIIEYIISENDMTAKECLEKMDNLRNQRIK